MYPFDKQRWSFQSKNMCRLRKVSAVMERERNRVSRRGTSAGTEVISYNLNFSSLKAHLMNIEGETSLQSVLMLLNGKDCEKSQGSF